MTISCIFEMIPTFLPRDLAKLVLGYLAEEQLMTAYDEFLATSPHLNSLTDVTDEYSRVYMKPLRSIIAEFTAVMIYVETVQPCLLRKILMRKKNMIEMVKFLVKHIDKKFLAENSSSLHSVFDCDVCSFLDLKSCMCRKKQSCKRKSRKISSGSNASKTETFVPVDLAAENSKNETHPNGSKVDMCVSTSDICEDNSFYKKNQEDTTNDTETEKQTAIVEEIEEPYDQIGSHGNAVCINLDESVTINNPNSNIFITNDKTTQQKTGQKVLMPLIGPQNYDKISVYPESIGQIVLVPNDGKNYIGTSNKAQQLPRYTLPCIECEPKCSKENDAHKIKVLSNIRMDNVYTCANIRKTNAITSSDPTKSSDLTDLNLNTTNTENPTPEVTLTYTKEQIMAMPTVIANVIPTLPGIKQTPAVHTQCPLTIDITSENDEQSLAIAEIVDSNLLIPVQAKDDSPSKRSELQTPNMISSQKKHLKQHLAAHIRVLDFNSPKKKLNHKKKLMEKVKDLNTTESPKDASVDLTVEKNVSLDNKHTEINNTPDKGGTVKKKPLKKYYNKNNNWDSDLRKLVGLNDNSAESNPSSIVNNNKINVTKKNVNTKNTKDNLISGISKEEPNVTDENKTDENKITQTNEMYVIVTNNNIFQQNETEKKEQKLNIDNMSINTQRNGITNSNVPDLGTPYKQVLYDLQMETPKFIGLDLPPDSFSDIKISNIPTPRFFDTPNLVANSNLCPVSPSPYSSRPTDYSSGSSYYKPDDNDYEFDLRDRHSCNSLHDSKKLLCSKKRQHLKEPQNAATEKKQSRPRRQCAQNISYFHNMSAKNSLVSDSTLVDMNDSKDKQLFKDKIVNETSDRIEEMKSKVNHDTIKKIKKIKPTDHVKIEKSPQNEDKNVSAIQNCEAKSLSESENKKEKSKKKAKNNSRNLTDDPNKKERNKISQKEIKCEKSKRSKIIVKMKPKSKNFINSKDKPHSSRSTFLKYTPTKKCADISESTSLVPAKSRRKSSTPRKINRSKSNHKTIPSEGLFTPNEFLKKTMNVTLKSGTVDGLNFSDLTPQNLKSQMNDSNDNDELSKIKKFIENTEGKQCDEVSINLQPHNKSNDINIGKSLEQVLQDSPRRDFKNILDDSEQSQSGGTSKVTILQENKDDFHLSTVEKNVESDLTVYDCSQTSKNYIEIDSSNVSSFDSKRLSRFNNEYTVEICIDEDDFMIKLSATPLVTLFELDPISMPPEKYHLQNFDLHRASPEKSYRSQCQEIFDSTLTSIDTPNPASSPINRCSSNDELPTCSLETEVSNIPEMNSHAKEIAHCEIESRKRRRSKTDTDVINDNKKIKSDAQYLLGSANIQNIDIESVLTKLHGP